MAFKNTINITEAKKILNYIIDNNKQLAEEGKKLNAIAFEGTAGIAKTSMVEQVAKERGMTFVKLNLSMVEETGDITGYPLKEYHMCDPSGKCQWISVDLIESYLNSGWTMEGQAYRMSYAIPRWVPREENPAGTILLLDDFSRTIPMLLQAVMELIDKQEYISWKLPKGTTVVLTGNVDDGSFNVNSLDDAFKTRYINFEVGFETSVWARWAEENKVRSEGINFALAYPEIFKKENNVQKVNARSFTAFINAISGIKDWSKPDNLAFILQIAQGCFINDDTNVVGSLFTTFIANKLDKLMDPESMLLKGWETVKKELEDQIYDGTKYRADIASILSTRFLNYTLLYFGTKGSKTDVAQKRILEFIENDKMLLSEDLIFNLIKTLNKNFPERCNKLLMNPKVLKQIL